MFFQAKFRSVRSYRLFVQTDPLAREEIGDLAFLILWGSNPVRISARLRLQFQKRI